MAFSAFIDDGYTEQGHIAEAERLHPAIDFTFRPLTAVEWLKCLHECDGLKLNELRPVEARWLAAHVQKWSLRDCAGNIVPINVSTMQKLKPALFGKLFGIVSGQKAGDSPPANQSSSDPTADAKN